MSKTRYPSALFGLLILLPLGAQMPASVPGANNTPTRGPLPGQIVIDPEHPQWLKRQGGEHLFICGPGDPEDFLYVGTRNPDGTRDGDQVQRIRKLIEHGGNCIYMQIVRTHGGDARPDRTHNPFVDSDPAKGVDPDILDQWEQWFTLMDRHDILIYLFFYDDSARPWDTGDRVGPAERAFLETIVKRFQHHRNLIWIVGEESEERYSTARVQAIAEVIRHADEHGHLIGDHHLSGTTFKAWRPEGALNHFAMQLGATDDAAHAGAVEALQKAAGRYQVIYSESTAMRTDEDGMRRHAWAVAMGGLMPMLLRMDIASTSVESLRQCRYLQRFFEATDFYRMAPRDELRHGETRYVLGNPGRSYIAYADSLADKLGVKGLPAGRCEVAWLDCRSGRAAEERHTLAHAGDHAFDKPPDFGPECAAWIRFPDRESGSSARAPLAAGGPVSSGNHPPVVEDQPLQTRAGAALYIQLKFEDDDGPGPYSYTIVTMPARGTLSGDNNDRVYAPNAEFIGTDRFTWKVNDGVGESKIATVTIAVSAAQGPGTGAAMAGPLRIHPVNPRYFTDGSGKAIYLTGSHTWNNLQYNGVYPRVEFDEYLDFLTKHNHNFIRLWAWEQGGWDPWAAGHVVVEPVAYVRTGPGSALDGKPKYDLTKFNDEYFERLRARVAAAQKRGIYVSIMLFQGWSVEKKGQAGNPWQGHPFNRANNLNGIDGDLNGNGQGPEIHTLAAPAEVLRLQQAYVRRVIDTVNDLDNVLYEIGNEMHTGSVQWQYRMIEFIHEYEKTKSRQHPVGMTGAPIANAALFASPADWIAPTGGDGYSTDPPAADGRKVIISDVDHVWPKQYRQWVWKSFARGLNTAFMDLYGATRIGDKDVATFGFVGDWSAQHDTVRKNMGYSRRLAERMNLAAMMPRGDLAGSGYCLANPGKEYLVYLPQGGDVTVDLSAASGPMAVEWLDPRSGDTTQGPSISGGEKRPFQPPFPGDAVLYLRSAGPQNADSTGSMPASPVLAQAARGIETHRKGDATIRFVRKDSTDASGVKIEVTQRRHDFAFGNVFRPRHYTNETYRARFLELFNFVQLLEFNWGQYETEEGKPKLVDRMEFINGWCREHGLTRFYGHMLVWSPQNNSLDRPNIPHWLFRHDRPTQDRLLKERIQREVLAYRDVDILWDVVNEAVHCRRWGDWDKKGYMDEPIPDAVPYVRDAFRWAHQANPQARLLLNDYRVIPQGKYRDRYIELIERLQKEKTPVHAIGIQAHDPYKGAYWFSPEEIWQACEQFGTQTGLPVHFTEFCYLSDSAQDIRGTYRPGQWNPQKQAEAIEEFYRVAFGHPAVASITYFGMGDDDPPWLPNLCLLDNGFQPKPAWNRLKKLIKEEWNTRQSGSTDATGTYRFRGFFGQYDIRVTDGEEQQTLTIHLEKEKPNAWSFTLSSTK